MPIIEKHKMIDPVDNFEIPDEWIDRAKIPLDELKSRILSGRYVLLSNGSLLRRATLQGPLPLQLQKLPSYHCSGIFQKHLFLHLLGFVFLFLSVQIKEACAIRIRGSSVPKM